MKRIKPTPTVIESTTEAADALARIARLDREIGAVEAQMQESIDAARELARRESADAQRERKEVADALAVFAKMHREKLFTKGKSLDLGHGVIGFRLSTSLVQEKGFTVCMSLQKLKDLGLHEGIRLKEELDKDTLSVWPDERLALVGMKRRKTDAFYIEIKQDVVPDVAA
jgi:phage host-nuclease inhibitor protein Gam